MFGGTQRAPLSSPVCPCSSHCSQRELCVPLWGTLLSLEHLPHFIIDMSYAIGTFKPSTATSWLLIHSAGCSVSGLVAEPLLHIFVAHGMCGHHSCFPRWLRMVLDISINYPRRISFPFPDMTAVLWTPPYVRLTTAEGATCAVRTKPLLERPSLGSQQVPQLPCAGGAGSIRCDLWTELHSVSECLWTQDKGTEPIRFLPCFFHVQKSRTEVN